MFCFVLKVGLDKIVNEKGCLQAGEEWLEHNLLTVAGIAVGIAFLQVTTSSSAYTQSYVSLNQIFSRITFTICLKVSQTQFTPITSFAPSQNMSWPVKVRSFLTYCFVLLSPPVRSCPSSDLSFSLSKIFWLQILGICFAQNLRADIFAQVSSSSNYFTKFQTIQICNGQ